MRLRVGDGLGVEFFPSKILGRNGSGQLEEMLGNWKSN